MTGDNKIIFTEGKSSFVNLFTKKFIFQYLSVRDLQFIYPASLLELKYGFVHAKTQYCILQDRIQELCPVSINQPNELYKSLRSV